MNSNFLIAYLKIVAVVTAFGLTDGFVVYTVARTEVNVFVFVGLLAALICLGLLCGWLIGGFKEELRS